MGRLGYVPSLLCAEFVMGRVCHVPSLLCAELSLNLRQVVIPEVEHVRRRRNLFEVENGQVSPLKAGSSSNQSFTHVQWCSFNLIAKYVPVRQFLEKFAIQNVTEECIVKILPHPHSLSQHNLVLLCIHSYASMSCYSCIIVICIDAWCERVFGWAKWPV